MLTRNTSYLEMLLNNDNDDDIDLEKLYELLKEYDNKIYVKNINNGRKSKVKSIAKSCLKKVVEFFCGICGCSKEEDDIDESHFVGLYNVGNNCYLNAALQILSRCYAFVIELLKYNYENDELLKLFSELMVTLLLKKVNRYNPTEFIQCFCRTNKNFVFGRENCSQDFIRTILKNINDRHKKTIYYQDYTPTQKDSIAYDSFIKENNIFPESKAYSIFNGILKIKIFGECSKCYQQICNYSYNSFVDQIIYLNSFSRRCSFSEVLKKNFGYENKAKTRCPKCNEKVNSKSISKFVKIPEIFIFTLERYLEPNKVPIEPEERINIYDFVDESLKINKNQCYYELFAVNIRLGNDISFGHEICHIKEKNVWFTINDSSYSIKEDEYYGNSYGLFYKRINREL